MENNFYHTPGRYSGILGWIFSTDHKRIGLLYLTSIFAFFFCGMLLGLAMRLELIAPGKQIVSAQTYNALFTVHGVIMIFLFIIPGIPAALGNFMLPLQTRRAGRGIPPAEPHVLVVLPRRCDRDTHVALYRRRAA